MTKSKPKTKKKPTKKKATTRKPKERKVKKVVKKKPNFVWSTTPTELAKMSKEELRTHFLMAKVKHLEAKKRQKEQKDNEEKRL